MAGMNIEEKEDIVRFIMDIKKERKDHHHSGGT
jgi:ABC-type branched-subunit amino acid transport system ATPase component